MGYRTYLYEISNDKLDEIKGMTVDEIEIKFGEIWFPDHMIRKICEYGFVGDTHNKIMAIAQPFFTIGETQEYFNNVGETNINIVDKEVIPITISGDVDYSLDSSFFNRMTDEILNVQNNDQFEKYLKTFDFENKTLVYMGY